MITKQITVEQFIEELNAFLDETFESVYGIYLDRGTSLFETLATVSAEEASRPVSSRCASIAGQVEHVRFYLNVLARHLRNEEVGKIDWNDSWQVKKVTQEEWEALKGRLVDQYRSLRTLIMEIDDWDREDVINGALAVVVHTAYHLGEIRQALCTVKG